MSINESNHLEFSIKIDKEKNEVEIKDSKGNIRKFTSILITAGNAEDDRLFSALYGVSNELARCLAGIFKSGRTGENEYINNIFNVFIAWVARHLYMEEKEKGISSMEELKLVLSRWEEEDKNKEDKKYH